MRKIANTILLLFIFILHSFAQKNIKFIEKTRVEAALYTTPLKEKEIQKALQNYISAGVLSCKYLGQVAKDSIKAQLKRNELHGMVRVMPYKTPGLMGIPFPSIILNYKIQITIVENEVKVAFSDFSMQNFNLFEIYNDSKDFKIKIKLRELDEKNYDSVYNRNDLSSTEYYEGIQKLINQNRGGYLMPEQESLARRNSSTGIQKSFDKIGQKSEANFQSNFLTVNEKWWDANAYDVIKMEFKKIAELLKAKITAVATNGEVKYKVENEKLLPIDEKEKAKWLKKSINF
ncbi:MAG: hypothetical protein HOO89_07160 [Ferruginibacter sp.]|nr:hypothetical protein [Ferruginibacter sp.]